MEENLTLSNCPDLESLDFQPHHPCFNLSDTTSCDEEWPCEIRIFWLQIHPFIALTRAFLSYGSLVIILLGVILNSLSAYIFLSTGLARNGSGVYLIALAFCDTGNLIANILLGVWRGASYEFNGYFMENEWLCRTHGVFVEVFQTISAWIVVAFTVERSLAVWYPLLFRQSRNRRAKLVVGSLTTVFTLFCLSKLFLTGFEKDSVFGYIPCNSRRYVWEGMAYVRVAFQTWIPTIIVFTFNCLMFWKLRKIKINRQRLSEHTRNLPKRPGPRLKQSFINKPSPTNPMLIAVSLAYLILVFPLGAVQTVELYWNLHENVPIAVMEPQKSAYVHWLMYKILLKHIRSFFFGFYQINFAINFFLYFAAGVEFRRYLQKKVKRMCGLTKAYCCCRGIAGNFIKSRGNTPVQSCTSNCSNATSTSTLPLHVYPSPSTLIQMAKAPISGVSDKVGTFESTI
ncbi:uncharacterized protein LOC110850394 [Folsomia candida]|uniref:uncharacterized protein LOC110850394 n=1 Tax=Folsomia candida TaxID=158441 RepID=UPI001604F584|nr:uncharacterized protein LOC110850394 [Folsomia candida]XP_035708134.1 uncharacterized protein LOC110850394 [Folsomia candida]XP_035708135.1 uncharacterized protein LOC110850394 [Folsomia candida]XP_035708136.1 uncharacterized protein LOC110850394 [Folsomia candida]